MSEASSILNRKRWAEISPAGRSQIMRMRARERWNKTTKKERKEWGKKLTESRLRKK